MTATYTVDELIAQDRSVDFERFGPLDARQLTVRIVATAEQRGLAITTAVWLGEQRVAQLAMPGTSADNDQWMERKAALVRRYDASSWLTTQRWGSYGLEQPSALIGLDPRTYTFGGGGFPIRVNGSIVGVAAVSGADNQTDHDLVLGALRAHREATGAGSEPGTAIRHTVVFRLVHAAGTAEERDFLDTARATLTAIPGVEEFAISRQVSPKSDLHWQFAMIFADQTSYDGYNGHPAHVGFVERRWQTEVAAFQEYDFTPR